MTVASLDNSTPTHGLLVILTVAGQKWMMHCDAEGEKISQSPISARVASPATVAFPCLVLSSGFVFATYVSSAPSSF